MIGRLCSASAIIALGWSGQGVGQVPTNQSPPPPSPQNPSPPATQAGLQDIVVTAERRSQNVQKSSLSIEVFSGRQLEAVTKIQDLTNLSPGVVAANRGSIPQVSIRGVGDTPANNTGQGAVAFSVDGIYFARQTAVGPSMFDISRVEVLKGPQGTLYGRNSTGGAVNILTNRPQLDQLSGYATGELGNYNLKRFEAALNVPLGSSLALRVAGQITSRDGYLSTGLDDEKTKSVRARLLFQPNDRVSVLLNGDLSHAGGLGGGYAIYPVTDGNHWRGSTQQPLLYPFLFNPSTAPLTQPNDSRLDNNNRGINAEINADLGFATLTFIPSYRYQDYLAVQYATNSRYAEHPKTEQLSGELRLGHDSEKLKWVVGGYYFRETQHAISTATLGALNAYNSHSKRVAPAGFAQATYSVTHRARLIAGARYTSERVTGNYITGTGAIGAVPTVFTGTTYTATPIQSNPVTYKVGAEFDLARNSMMYATYSTGFKAGGFNPTTRCGELPYKAEDLKALNGGIRNRFLDNRLQVNAEGFYWKYTNQQVTTVGLDPCGDVGQITYNPGRATITGADLDVVFRLTPSDTLHASMEYARTDYDSFFFTQLGLGIYAPASGTRCRTAAAAGRPGFFNIDCSGEPLARTPKWSGTAGYQHVFNLGESQLAFDADAQFASSRWMDQSYIPNGHVDGYARLNTQLTYTAPRGRWSLSAYVNNITNAAVYTGGLAISSTLARNGNNYYVNAVEPPRTFGARLRINFKS